MMLRADEEKRWYERSSGNGYSRNMWRIIGEDPVYFDRRKHGLVVRELHEEPPSKPRRRPFDPMVYCWRD